jgi:hypothetical protein
MSGVLSAAVAPPGPGGRVQERTYRSSRVSALISSSNLNAHPRPGLIALSVTTVTRVTVRL